MKAMKVNTRYYVPLLRRNGELFQPVGEFKHENTARLYARYMMDKADIIAAVLVDCAPRLVHPIATFAWQKPPSWVREN